MSNSEITFYQDQSVFITNTRAVIGGKTYAMANITSVTVGEIAAKRIPGILIAAIGGPLTCCCGVLLSAGLTSMFAVTLQNQSSSGPAGALGTILNIGFLLVSFLIVVGGVALAIMAKPTYVVKIGSSSGEADALLSKDKEYILKIVNALNDAIVKRG